MAEAIVIVSAVASVVQLFDFSSRIVRRLEEFRAAAGEVPNSFRQISTELPVLSIALQELNEALDRHSLPREFEDALCLVLSECRQQMKELDSILSKLLYDDKDSWHKRGKKAIESLRCDGKVEVIRKSLSSYIAILTFYCAAASPAFSFGTFLDQQRRDNG